MEKKYGFIAPDDGTDDLIVFKNDLPATCRMEGAKVEYSREKSYDRKKDRESWKAVLVTKLKKSE